MRKVLVDCQDWLFAALLVALFILSATAVHAHERTDKECREAGDMIEHLAMSRDSGAMTASLAMGAFAADVILTNQFSPDQRWFVEDQSDADVLLAGIARVLRSLKPPREQGNDFFEDCRH
jgi:hypothetical protein